MQSLAGIVELMKGDSGGLVPFTVGELFGPCRCAHDGCETKAWSIWMTPDEYEAAKTQEDVHPVIHVFSHGIGTALCDEHRPTGSA
jgi:hypothetical protein